MKPIARLFFVVLVASQSIAGSAAVVSIDGGGVKGLGTTGILSIVFNTEPQNRTFMNGGIGLEMTVGTPGVIEFTTANIINNGRWAAVINGNVTPNATGTLSAFSVLTPGLPSGTHVVHAEIGYKTIGYGQTDIFVAASGEDPLYDGTIPPFGADVSGEISFVPTSIFVFPEPGSMVMAGMGLIGLVLRRRHC